MSNRQKKEDEAERKQALWKDLVDHVNRGEESVKLLEKVYVAGVSGGLRRDPKKPRVFVEMSEDLWQALEVFFYFEGG